jgi:hypothetical protein
MADINFVLVALAFFGLCVVYIRACDRLVRGSEGAPAPAGEPEATDNVTPITAEVAR